MRYIISFYEIYVVSGVCELDSDKNYTIYVWKNIFLTSKKYMRNDFHNDKINFWGSFKSPNIVRDY